MPDVNPSKIQAFDTPEALAEWFSVNHARESELWVKIFKKHTGVASITWDDVVVESLCWGWIDGVKKTVDDKAYVQRITPRKAGSNWSKRNREHVERLLKEGRMQKPGLVQVRAAQANGKWDQAYTASEYAVPDDFVQALEAKPGAKAFYETLTKASRYVIAYGLASAKKPETRQKRFEKYIDMLEREVKPG